MRQAGGNISKAKYDQMRTAILHALQPHGEMTFKSLNDAVGTQLEGEFDGSIGWYYTTVKLDLEARNILMRISKTSPQRIHLTGSE
ncbi:MAG: hypothetical protein GY943_16385 [Chloroflexi bacterium]|nr:hypothetical protein [Chloroflexota bacterium]